MTLKPKAKPIRIRIVSGGEEHSSIETLRKNYSLEDIRSSVKDGQLHKWLERVGQNKAAEAAKDLKGKDIKIDSKSMVELTALIFHTNANSIWDLLFEWKKIYPVSFSNYLNGTFQDISTVRQLFKSFKDEMPIEKWRTVFLCTLKKITLPALLEDFKKNHSERPMTITTWSKVLEYHANKASDEDLYLIAQAAYENPTLKGDAEEWFQKSARSYDKAKEWVKNNIQSDTTISIPASPTSKPKHTLPPKEEELFKAFEKAPSNFSQRSYNSSYPLNLVRFLDRVSTLFRNNRKPNLDEITGLGNFSRYLFIIERLYYMTSRYYANNTADKVKCIQGLKQLPTEMQSSYYFKNYQTLYKIIKSIEMDSPIWDNHRLSKLNYKQALLLIVELAKRELGNEK